MASGRLIKTVIRWVSEGLGFILLLAGITLFIAAVTTKQVPSAQMKYAMADTSPVVIEEVWSGLKINGTIAPEGIIMEARSIEFSDPTSPAFCTVHNGDCKFTFTVARKYFEIEHGVTFNFGLHNDKCWTSRDGCPVEMIKQIQINDDSGAGNPPVRRRVVNP